MIITCGNCKTSYELDESLVKATGTQVRCTNCQFVFTAYPKAHPAVADNAGPEAVAGAGTGAAAVSGGDEDLDLDLGMDMDLDLDTGAEKDAAPSPGEAGGDLEDDLGLDLDFDEEEAIAEAGGD